MKRLCFVLVVLAIATTARAQGFLPPSTGAVTLTNGACATEGVSSTGCLTLTTAGYAGVAMQITGNASANTITFRASADRINFVAVNCFAANSTTAVTSTTTPGLYHCGVAGFAMVEAIITNYIAGTAVITINASPSADGSGTSAAGSGSNPAAGATGSAVPASASYTGVNSSGTLVGLPGDTTNGAWVNCKSGCAAAGDSTSGSASIASNVGNTSTYPNGPAPYGLSLAGDNGAAFTVAGSGSLVATLTPQCSTDGGTTYPVNGYLVDPVTGVLTTSVAVSSPAQTVYQVLCPQGSSHASLKATAFTSGTSSFTGRATVVKTVAGLGVGAVSSSAPSYTTGTLGALSIDTSGNLRTVTSLAANSSVNVAQINGNTTSTAATGVQKVGIVGNTAAVLDAAGQNVAQPANWLSIGCGFNTTPTTITTGNGSPCQLDSAGNLLVNLKTAIPTGANTIGAVTQSGNWTFRLFGNTGAVLDAAGQNVSAPANAVQIGGQFNTTPTTITSGNFSPLQLTSAARLIVDGSQVTQPVSGTVTANAGSGTFNIQANASVNLAQVNGTTTSTGNGTSNAGDARVNVASDNSAIANWGQGATGSAAPANAVNAGFLTGDATAGGHLKTPIYCDGYKFDRSTTADVQLVAVSGSTVIYVCGYRITGESTTSSDVSLEYGTGSNCGTGTTGLTPPTTIGSGTAGGQVPGLVIPPGLWSGLKTTASQALCVHRSAAQTSEIEVWYTQF